jgi:hypothetical protein
MLIKQLMPEIERREGIDPQQLALEEQQNKLNFDKQKTETEQNKFKQEQATKELEFKVSTVKQTHNIEEDAWNDAFSYLDKNLPKEETITVSAVKERVLFSRSESVLEELDSKLLSQPELISAIVRVQEQNPDFDHNDLMAVAREGLGYAETEQVKEKLEKVTNKQTKQKDVPKEGIQPITNSMGEEIDDWDDLL